MRFNQLAACALAGSICLAGITATAEGKHCTIADLYAQTRDGWHAEYTAPVHEKFGGIPEPYRFTVDVELQVPDVQAFPVLDLVINKDIFEDDTTVHLMDGQVRLNGELESQTMFDYQTGEGIWFDSYLYPVMPDGQAENNPLRPADAETIFRNCVYKYFGVDNMVVSALAGFSVTPQLTQRQQDAGQDRFYQVMAQGLYMLEGRQVFEGIPLIASGSSWKRYFPSLLLKMTLLSNSCYDLCGTTLNQKTVVYEDVPLLPWPEIQEAFEKQCIRENLMYDVYSAMLGYQLTITRKGKNTGIAGYDGELKTYPDGTFDEIYTTRPVWVFRGKIPIETAGYMKAEQIESQKSTFESDPGLAALFSELSDALLINAQTGELIHATTDLNLLDDVFPNIRQWSDVE